MKTTIMRVSPLLAASLLVACASAPKGPPPEIVRLQDQLSRLRADPRIANNAVDEISRADAAVSLLARESRTLKEPMFRHGIYIADRLVQTAEASGLARYAEVRGTELGVERDRLLVDVRTQEADSARRVATAAIAAANSERRSADVARADLQSARIELETMRSKLTELETRQTERGLVVTLGDVLFEIDRAELKPGAARSLDQLAMALRDDPNATVAVEGHTDSTGARDYNIDLSARRAESVRSYLVRNGANAATITSRGLGPDYPVASNGTDAGRQQNRRVEVIVNSTMAR
ncbi:MAG: OmpA family protein [Dokdonella sp.]